MPYNKPLWKDLAGPRWNVTCLLNQTKIDPAKNQQSFTSFVYKNANKNTQNHKGRFFRSAAESGCFYLLSLLRRCVNPPRPNIFFFGSCSYLMLLVISHRITVESILIFIPLYKRIAFIPLFSLHKHSLRVGWRNLFFSCAVVCQFFGSGGK